MTGLTSDEALRRLEKLGTNAVPDTATHPLRRALTKFWAPILGMLEAAIVLEALLGKYVEADIIAVLLILNAVLGFIYEGRATRAGVAPMRVSPAKAISKYLDGAREERRLYVLGQHPRQLAAKKPRLKSPKSYVREGGIVAHLKAFFTGKLVQITPAQVSDYLTGRLSKVSKASVRKELISLRHLFRLAVDDWEFLPDSHRDPTRKIRAKNDLRGHDIERTQHLTPEQFRRVLAAAPDIMKPIFALLTATALRRTRHKSLHDRGYSFSSISPSLEHWVWG